MDDEEQKHSLLDESLARSESTEDGPSHREADRLVDAIVESALAGTLTYDRSVAQALRRAIEVLDHKISRQLAAVMHCPEFQQLESTWRGLRHLVFQTETDPSLQIRVLPVSLRELQQDFTEQLLEETLAFRTLYEDAFETADGDPVTLLVSDFAFDRAPGSVDVLRNLATVAASTFCPLIAAADAQMFAAPSFEAFPGARELQRSFEQPSAIPWKAYRQSEEARFVTLTVPRVLARLPYGTGDSESTVSEFRFEEFAGAAERTAVPRHGDYCWMSASWLLAERFVDAWNHAEPGTAIPGLLCPMRVPDLPLHITVDEWRDEHVAGPTEMELSHPQAEELGSQGFVPLCSFRGEDAAAFLGVQTTQLVQKYADAATQQNAEMFAQLPCVTLVAYFGRCVMALVSRCAHHLLLTGEEDQVTASQYQEWMNAWLSQFVGTTPAQRAQFPLAEAHVVIRDERSAPGCYRAELSLKPWLAASQAPAPITIEFSVPRVGG